MGGCVYVQESGVWRGLWRGGGLAGWERRKTKGFSPSPHPLQAYHLDTLQAAFAPSL